MSNVLLIYKSNNNYAALKIFLIRDVCNLRIIGMSEKSAEAEAVGCCLRREECCFLLTALQYYAVRFSSSSSSCSAKAVGV